MTVKMRATCANRGHLVRTALNVLGRYCVIPAHFASSLLFGAKKLPDRRPGRHGLIERRGRNDGPSLTMPEHVGRRPKAARERKARGVGHRAQRALWGFGWCRRCSGRSWGPRALWREGGHLPLPRSRAAIGHRGRGDRVGFCCAAYVSKWPAREDHRPEACGSAFLGCTGREFRACRTHDRRRK